MGGKRTDLCRTLRNRRFDCYLRQHAQPQQKSRYPDWKRIYHGRSHERGSDGGGGVYSAKAGMKLAEAYGIDMPIVEQVNQVLLTENRRKRQ